jgi:hypothetical protein
LNCQENKSATYHFKNNDAKKEQWDTDSTIVDDTKLLEVIKEKRQSMNLGNEKLI